MTKITIETVRQMKCRRCKYYEDCRGLRDQIRMECEEFKRAANPQARYSSVWNEMSFRRYSR